MKATKDGILAQDIMVRRLHTVRPDDRVFTAVKVLLAKRISGAPVVERGGKLVGMLSEKDCIQALMRAVHDQLPPSMVRDVMSADVLTVGPTAPLLTVAHIFLTNPVRRLPVAEDGKLLGQISRRDLLKAAVDIFEGAGDRKSAVLYLSAVSDGAPESVTGRRRRR